MKRIAQLGLSTLGIVLLILLLLFLLGAWPTFGFHSYGYVPSGFGFVLLVVLIVLIATDRL